MALRLVTKRFLFASRMRLSALRYVSAIACTKGSHGRGGGGDCGKVCWGRGKAAKAEGGWVSHVQYVYYPFTVVTRVWECSVGVNVYLKG